jgi:hypothetical protein
MLEKISDSQFNKLSLLIGIINQRSNWQIEVNRFDYYIDIRSTYLDLQGQYFDNIIYFDRQSLWDKPRKCPVSIDLDNSLINIDAIVQEISWLLTAEGYTASNKLTYRPMIVYTQKQD